MTDPWTPTFQFAVVRAPYLDQWDGFEPIVGIKQLYRNTLTGEREWRDVPEYEGEE